MDSIVRGNRARAHSKMVVRGGEAGKMLAKEARLAETIREGRVEVGGEEKDVFIFGLHPMTDDYIVL